MAISRHQRRGECRGTLFRPVKNNTTGELRKQLNPKSVYDEVVKHYGTAVGITVDVHGFCVHPLRATAATNALAHNTDIAMVQEWQGHANVSTARIYERGGVSRKRARCLRRNTDQR
jgi:integrase/recombinase XerD